MQVIDHVLRAEAAKNGISYDVLYQRLKNGWTPHRATTTPVRQFGKRYTVERRPGELLENKTIAELAATIGISVQTFYRRLNWNDGDIEAVMRQSSRTR